MLKKLLILAITLSLTACATAPKPAKLKECPTIPAMLWDAPERDWQGQMQNFLQGTLPTQQNSKPHTTPANKPTTR